MTITAATLWPDYRRQLRQEGVAEGPDTNVSAAFCARADMPLDDALTTR
jgi:hypothetical protein